MTAVADTILKNGVVLTMDRDNTVAQALAISGDRIVDVGSNDEINTRTEPGTRVIDLAGKTVIPGLIDTHIHAIRGGQTYHLETYWFGVPTLAAALDRLGKAASERSPNQWAAVVGSWHPEQFAEKRAPTVEDLTNVAPDNPVYVQYLYDYAIVNGKGIEALRLNDSKNDLPKGIKVERSMLGLGGATGKLTGSVVDFNQLFATIAEASKVDKKASLKAFLTELNRRGVTAFVDPAAGPPEAYDPLFELWEEKRLTLRAAYRIPAQTPGNEAEWFSNVMAFRPPLFRDGLLSVAGMGEFLVFGMNDEVQMGPGFDPPKEAREELVKVAKFAAERRFPLEIHAYTDDAAAAILDAFEIVAKSCPLHKLRWCIAHLNTGSARTFDRMKNLGIAYTVQMGPYFEAPAIEDDNRKSVAEATPPYRLALDRELMVAGGTDSTRIGVFGAWQAIEYAITGCSLGRAVQRRADFLLSREEALRLYTANAAWVTFDEEERGTLEVGKLADLAVLDAPYLTMPQEKIHSLRSVLTMVNGVVVHSVDA
jgi:predicted amidohydrolase YtcJ